MADAARKLTLHQLVDELPESEMLPAQRYLEYLRDRGDRVDALHKAAPFDDEPLSPEEEAAIEEALEDVRNGNVFSLEELERELSS